MVSNKTYVDLTINPISFTEVKHYLANYVIPKAIVEYAKFCTKDVKNNRVPITGSVLKHISDNALNNIDSSIDGLKNKYFGYLRKHGYSDYCNSIEKTLRIWENAKLKFQNEDGAYFEEIIGDSIKNINESLNRDSEKWASSMGVHSNNEEVLEAVKRIITEAKLELNNTDYKPWNDLGKYAKALLRGGKGGTN